MAHFLKFREDGLGSTGAKEDHAIVEATNDLTRELLTGEDLFGENAVRGQDQADAFVQFHRKATGIGTSRVRSHT
jgi:hypothetical protein